MGSGAQCLVMLFSVLPKTEAKVERIKADIFKQGLSGTLNADEASPRSYTQNRQWS